MLLAFDVGNTNIVVGVFKDGELITNWRMETDTKKSADEYGMIISRLFEYEGLDMKEVEDTIISTVVPSILFTMQHLSQKYFHTKADRERSGTGHPGFGCPHHRIPGHKVRFRLAPS